MRCPALLGLLILCSGSPARAQEGDLPAFSAGAEAIVVDVVVVDEEGRPVRGLGREDFTVEEDGRPQALVAFDAIEIPVEAPQGPGRESLATNLRVKSFPTRLLTLLVDDTSLDATRTIEVKAAIARWLAESARPTDEVTLVTSSGDIWWSDRVASGREDLLAILDSVRGKRPPPSEREQMSEVEAFRIATQEGRAQSVAETRGFTPELPQPEQITGLMIGTRNLPSITERVKQRWYTRRVCDPGMEPQESCRARVEQRAQELYDRATRRGRSLLRTVERLSTGLSGRRGRNTILVFSEGFIHDQEGQQAAFERTVDASRRANTAVYFIDARGLVTLPAFAPESANGTEFLDPAVTSLERALVASAGTENLARTTGGATIRDTNDLFGGLERVAEESAVYYLLGYQPEQAPDGRWHDLEVSVARPGVEVRARRGYYASADVPESGRALKQRQVAHLYAGGDREGVPLRMASFVLGPADTKGLIRTLLALEVDMAAVRFAEGGGVRTALLDLTIMAASRRQARHVIAVDERVEVDVTTPGVGGWWSIYRQVELPPGVVQVRALVADRRTGQTGTVGQRIELPGSRELYMSTPVLSDRLGPPRGDSPWEQVEPVARRRFPSRGTLYCQYEVFGAEARVADGAPEVAAGYGLRDARGRIVSLEPPSAIDVAADGRVVRRLAFDLSALAAGSYELALDVEDRVSGLELFARERFVVEGSPEIRSDVTDAPPESSR
jgi:VWFA-related protein